LQDASFLLVIIFFILIILVTLSKYSGAVSGEPVPAETVRYTTVKMKIKPYYQPDWSFAMNKPVHRFHWFYLPVIAVFVLYLTACSAVQPVPPEVNLMRLDVRDITLSHVNLLADLRVFNPNDTSLTIQGVDYTLYLEGIKVFTGKNNLARSIPPQEYGQITLRLSSAYWDIIQLFNTLPDRSDVAFSMHGSIRVGKSSLFARRFSFNRKGIIPLRKTLP
jgi:LEA14-like dessication related protein